MLQRMYGETYVTMETGLWNHAWTFPTASAVHTEIEQQPVNLYGITDIVSCYGQMQTL